MGAVSFEVKQSALKEGSQDLRQYRNTLRTINMSVKEAKRVMSCMQGSITLVCGSLSKIESKINTCADKTSSMAGVLEEIAGFYGNTEAILTNSIKQGTMTVGAASSSQATGTEEKEGPLESFWKWICSLFGWGDDAEGETEPFEIDSVVFDDTGDYGGDQGAPQNQTGQRAEELYDIVREHFPDMSDEEIESYLKKLNTEGCSYVATINTIFAAYEGREEEFERIFGFPMYKDGDLNYNELLVDFYCETDNHNKGLFGGDKIDSSEDPGIEEGNGATSSQQIYRAEKYLHDKGVEVDISKRNDITVENFNEFAEDGYVVINYFDGPLQNEDGSTRQNITGHSMTITGVTDDGRYIVSSWGEKYYIDPSQGRINYVYYEYN